MADAKEKLELELCLDFSNTLDWRNARAGKVAKDGLTDYGRLVDWSTQHGLLREEEGRRVLRMARESGKDRSTLRRAIDLRETIYRTISALVHGTKPENKDVDELNGFVSESMARARLIRSGETFEWSWSGSDAPDSMLWPIARSAAELLTSDRLKDVRECANEEEGCGWLFLDCTKNHSRRWCSTTGCGNRDKVRRFYETHRETPT